MPPLLVFADDWGRHPSSCQHLIRRLQGKGSILWVNSIGTRRIRANVFTVRRIIGKLNRWRQGLHQVADRMWVLDLPMLPTMFAGRFRDLNQKLVSWRLNRALTALGMDAPIVLTTLPQAHWMIADVPHRSVIYYCTDDFSHWPDADRDALMEADRELTRCADLLLAASRALLDTHGHARRCEYFPHGVDIEHFAAAGRLHAPDAVASLPSPRIGYFGLIYEKLDFPLLHAVARQFKHGSLVMIGPVDYCDKTLANLPNVHLLGRKPYDELPRWLAGLDVLLLPYVDDEMIRQSGPLKLRECLASGKPTVSIDVPENRQFEPHVRIGRTHAEFIEHITQALAERDVALRTQRQQVVQEDDWSARADQLLASLNSRAVEFQAISIG
jgi:glycosyltransferase involved in cell wall biosynthesis